ncbi:PE-PGRS family protein [Streptomyces sp. NPDC088785]|uniref:WXG100-like domain-containing protein n=1 Tax=Streptomyces sp. NPDC088785 TaxID=3365897 RepID=UPI00382FC2EA
MALTLPSEIEWVLDLLGYSWPDADEDRIHEAAQAWREFAGAVRRAQGTGTGAARTVLAANSGAAVEGFGAAWQKFSGAGGGYLEDAAQAAEILSFALDAVALVVIGSKVAVIAQLIALAIEIAAAQAAAPLTLGLSELGAAGATQATRLVVRRLLDELKRLVLRTIEDAVEQASVKAIREMIVEVLKEAAAEAGRAAGRSIVEQGVKTHFGAQRSIDFGAAAGAGYESFKETAVSGIRDGLQEKADGITGLVDPRTYIDAGTDRATEAAGNRVRSGVDALRGGAGAGGSGADEVGGSGVDEAGGSGADEVGGSGADGPAGASVSSGATSTAASSTTPAPPSPGASGPVGAWGEAGASGSGSVAEEERVRATFG